MRYFVLITFILFGSTTQLAAEEREAIYGVWGNQNQCSRAPIKPGGTALSQPFEISARWIRQGQFWCSLEWGPLEARKNGIFTAANARCGEDTVRGYFLGMNLSDGQLKLSWDLGRSNGPLIRCPK